MSFLQSLLAGICQAILPVALLIIIITFVHELGHLLLARYYGIYVTEFSIGLGKEIFGFYDKHGTRWKICWLPLGGYARFRGDEQDDAKTSSLPSMEAYDQIASQNSENTLQAPNDIYHSTHGSSRHKTFHGTPHGTSNDHEVSHGVTTQDVTSVIAQNIIIEREHYRNKNISLLAHPFKSRILTVLAGPLANYLLSFLIFTFLFSFSGIQTGLPQIKQMATMQLPKGLHVGDKIVAIEKQRLPFLAPGAAKNSSATETGLFPDLDLEKLYLEASLRVNSTPSPIPIPNLTPPGSRTEINGVQAAAESGLGAAVKVSDSTISGANNPIINPKIDPTIDQAAITVLKNGKAVAVWIPKSSLAEVKSTLEYRRNPQNILNSIKLSLQKCYELTALSVSTIYGLITQKEGAGEVSSILGIAHMAAKSSSLLNYLQLVASLSLSLGFINLLPIPGLDGGHLFIYSVERILNRRLPLGVLNAIMRVGISIIIALMVFATYNDIIKLGLVSKMLKLVGIS